MHMRHIVLLSIAIVFSWILWIIVNLDVYSQLNGKALLVEILNDFLEQVLETTILLELSLLYIRGIVKVFWNSPHNMKIVLIQVMILAVLNGISSIIMGLAYSVFFPDQEHLLTKIAYTDYINLSVLTTAYLVVFLINRYRDETDAHLEELVDLAHPLGVTLCEVVVYRNYVNALTCKRIEVYGKSSNECLTFTCLHLGDTALMQDDTADQLYAEMLHTKCTLRRLPADRERFRKKIVQRLAF